MRQRWLIAGLVVLVGAGHRAASAQDVQAPSDTRAGDVIQLESDKVKDLHPYEPNKVEKFVNGLEDSLLHGKVSWHPWFESAYAGGGFVLGAGYARHVSSYNILDLRASYSIENYKRIEAEFLAPRIFDRRGTLSVIGGWREATKVGFFGFGTPNTSIDDRANYSFQQPYGQAALDLRPARNWFVLGAGFEYTMWDQGAGHGSVPSVDEVYTPETLPGLDSSPTYVHTQATVGLDTRTSPGYSRKGTYLAVTAHNFDDVDNVYGFRMMNYEAIQHLPLPHDTWVLSLHARVQTTSLVGDQQIPFFMTPALGGGSALRGFTSWRFRDRHSLLLSAEWRVLANHFLDMAIFWDPAFRISTWTASSRTTASDSASMVRR
jgi:outer membrane protein assembly factor BamA